MSSNEKLSLQAILDKYDVVDIQPPVITGGPSERNHELLQDALRGGSLKDDDVVYVRENIYALRYPRDQWSIVHFFKSNSK